MSDRLSDTFRDNVRAAMHLRGMSQGELMRQVGLHRTAYRMQIDNPRNIGVTLATVAKYADALGVDALTLLTPGGVERERTEQAA